MLVVCEDMSSSLFSETKNVFQEAMGVDSCQGFEEEDVKQWWPDLHDAMSEHGLPDIYSAGHFRSKGRGVVGIGRDKEHRKRAACLGMAMMCTGDRYRWWDPKWRIVQNEVFKASDWFPAGFFNGFCDLRGEHFWQNIESWGRNEQLKTLRGFCLDLPLNEDRVIED